MTREEAEGMLRYPAHGPASEPMMRIFRLRLQQGHSVDDALEYTLRARADTIGAAPLSERRRVWCEAAVRAPIGGQHPPENWGRLCAEYADALLAEFDKRFAYADHVQAAEVGE